MLTLALTGDVMLGRLVNDKLKTMLPQEVWGNVLPHLLQADLRAHTILNLSADKFCRNIDSVTDAHQRNIGYVDLRYCAAIVDVQPYEHC
jgi:hypothetical protein